MDNIFNFLLVSLATWRLSSLFAQEDGPFSIFLKFRFLVGVRYNEQNEEIGTNEFSRGLLCPWCNSLWISAFMALIFADSLISWFIYTLSISAVAIFINGKID